jgi:hypothetical protein
MIAPHAPFGFHFLTSRLPHNASILHSQIDNYDQIPAQATSRWWPLEAVLVSEKRDAIRKKSAEKTKKQGIKTRIR